MTKLTAEMPAHNRHFIFELYGRELMIATLATNLLWFVYKWAYPDPDFITDSMFYVSAAQSGDMASIWPIGYSWFLQAVRELSASDKVLTYLQYAILQSGAILLIFTIAEQFIKERRTEVSALIIIVAVNPMHLFLANLVTSDPLFTGLSYYWFVLIVKIITRPKSWHFLAMALLLAYLFTIRYQAMFYPIVAIGALIIAKGNRIHKFLSAGLAAILIVVFILAVKKDYRKQYGIDTFSGLSGWQLINNALYMYPELSIDQKIFKTETQKTLYKGVKAYFDTTGGEAYYSPTDGPKYMHDMDGPLKYYQFKTLKRPQGSHNLWPYMAAGKDFSKFASTLIANHPISFTTYFILPNTLTYFHPMMEQFEVYAEGRKKMDANVARWFKKVDPKITARWPRGSYFILLIYPMMFMLGNVLLIGCVIYYLIRRKTLNLLTKEKRILGMVTLFILVSAGFSILAAPVMIRYQIFPLVLISIALTMFLAKAAREEGVKG